MITVFDELFPQDVLDLEKKISNMRSKHNKSIPKLLLERGFLLDRSSKMYLNPSRNILLSYQISDIKNQVKRQDIFDKLTNLNVTYPYYEFIYGFLRPLKNGVPDDSIIMNNVRIRLLSGEYLLKYLFEDYNQILLKFYNEISEMLDQDSVPETTDLDSFILSRRQSTNPIVSEQTTVNTSEFF